MKRHLVIAFVVLLGCESKPEVQVPDGGFPPPSISAAPGSKPPPPPEAEPKPAPSEAPADEADEAADVDPSTFGEAAEPPTRKRRSASSRGGVGGIGTSGSGSGGDVASGDGSLDGLLEAKTPTTWTVRYASSDSSDKAAANKLLQRKLSSMQRCLSFLKDDVRRLRCNVTFAGGAVKDVATVPANETTGECVKTQLATTRFPGPPTKLSFEFRR